MSRGWMRGAVGVLAAAGLMAPATGAAAEPLRLHTAGGLKAAMTEVAAAFTAAGGPAVETRFGPSGLLRESIAGGAPADVFASANMKHPDALAKAGLAATSDTLLDPAVRLAASTPKADPSGDYAWALFAKAERLKPGARALLEAKAMQLTGGPSSPPPPKDRSQYGLIMERGEADIFLTYCTNARLAAREVPGLQVVAVPEPLAVGADYGLVVLGSRPEAARLALFILSPAGQRILAEYGFTAPGLPAS